MFPLKSYTIVSNMYRQNAPVAYAIFVHLLHVLIRECDFEIA